MNPFGMAQSRIGPATKGLLIALVATFIAQLIARNFLNISLEVLLGFRPLSFLSGHIYQLATYPFLHGSLTHILFNALILYSVGSGLEARWGTKRFLKYYAVCAIGGAILQTLVWLGALFIRPDVADAFGNIPIVGASGALYGLFMAFGRLYGDSQVLVFFVFPMRAKHFVVVLASIEIISVVFSGDRGLGGGVAHLVHLGGLGTGYLYLKLKGDDLNRRGGGGSGLKRRFGGKMSQEEIRSRLRVVVDNDPKTGDKNYPITWN